MIQQIYSAADEKLDVQTLCQAPRMEMALNGYLEPVTFVVVTKEQDPVSFKIVEHLRSITTTATIQPLRAREIALKPEGERRWTWYKIFALPELALEPKDIIRIGETQYRVMGSKGWRPRGFMYYEIVEDYDG